MSPREQSTAVKLLNRWYQIYKSNRVRPDPDVRALGIATDAFLYPVSVPRPIEEPTITPIGNLNDIARNAGGK